MKITNDEEGEVINDISKAALIIDALSMTNKWIIKVGSEEDGARGTVMALPMEELTIKGEQRVSLIDKLCTILMR